jgi:hypothetical protein
MRRKLMVLAAAAALGSLLAAGCEKKTVTTTETETKTTESGAPTPATTPMMSETPVPPATTPTP